MSAPQQFVALLLAAGQALAPLIRRFVTLGLNRVWLHSGDLIYRCSSHSPPLHCHSRGATGAQSQLSCVQSSCVVPIKPDKLSLMRHSAPAPCFEGGLCQELPSVAHSAAHRCLRRQVDGVLCRQGDPAASMVRPLPLTEYLINWNASSIRCFVVKQAA